MPEVAQVVLVRQLLLVRGELLDRVGFAERRGFPEQPAAAGPVKERERTGDDLVCREPKRMRLGGK